MTGAGNEMSFKAPSNPNQSMILSLAVFLTRIHFSFLQGRGAVDGDLYNETTGARDICLAFSVCVIFNPLGGEVMYQRKQNYLIHSKTFLEIESLSLWIFLLSARKMLRWIKTFLPWEWYSVVSILVFLKFFHYQKYPFFDKLFETP